MSAPDDFLEDPVLEDLDAQLDASVEGQYMHDTCEEHGVWCCPICFDMSDSGIRVVLPPPED